MCRCLHAGVLAGLLVAEWWEPCLLSPVPGPPPQPNLQEGECFKAAAALDTHKALVHIFFAQRSTKKIRGAPFGGGWDI